MKIQVTKPGIGAIMYFTNEIPVERPALTHDNNPLPVGVWECSTEWQYKMPNELEWTSDLNHEVQRRGFLTWYDEMKGIADFDTRIIYRAIKADEHGVTSNYGEIAAIKSAEEICESLGWIDTPDHAQVEAMHAYHAQFVTVTPLSDVEEDNEDLSYLAGLPLSEIYLHGVISGQKKLINSLKKEIENKTVTNNSSSGMVDEITLRNAFQAGQAFENECNCGECDYCMLFPEKSPDFTTWYRHLINQIKSLK